VATNVQQNTGSGAVGAGLTATVTLSTPTTAGNKVLVAAIMQTAGTVVGTGSGLTTDVAPNLSGSGTNRLRLYSKDTTGGETSWTLTGFAAGADAIRWIAIEVSGLSTGAVDKTATNTGSVTPVASRDTGTTATTTQANELAVALVGSLIASGSPTYSWSNGFAQQGATGNVAVSGAVSTLGVAFLELSTTQTVTTTVTFSPNAAALGCVATYKESGGAPAPTGGFLPYYYS